MNKIVFFDLETGGLNPLVHPITQIAAIAVSADDFSEIESYEQKVRFDESTADAEALERNHYNADVWRETALPERQVTSDFADFLSRHATVKQIAKRTGRPFFVAQLAGHNCATFDSPFLQNFFKRNGQFLPASFLTLDTLQRAQWFFMERICDRPENLKLETLCKYFEVAMADGTAHDALADVRATLSFYKSLRARCAA